MCILFLNLEQKLYSVSVELSCDHVTQLLSVCVTSAFYCSVIIQVLQRFKALIIIYHNITVLRCLWQMSLLLNSVHVPIMMFYCFIVYPVVTVLSATYYLYFAFEILSHLNIYSL